MPHCYSIGIKINGREEEVCSIVPGNDVLRRDVEKAERLRQEPRAPTAEEVQRAVDYFTSRRRQNPTPNDYHEPHD